MKYYALEIDGTKIAESNSAHMLCKQAHKLIAEGALFARVYQQTSNGLPCEWTLKSLAVSE